MEFFNINNVFILTYIAIIKKTEFQEKFFSPFRSRGKMSYSFQSHPLPHAKWALKTLFSQPFPFPLSTKRERLQSNHAWIKKQSTILCGTPCTEIKFVLLLNIDSIVKTFSLIITSSTYYFCVTPCIKAEILTLNRNVLRKIIYV